MLLTKTFFNFIHKCKMKALSQFVSFLNQTQLVHLSNLSHVIKIAFFKPCVDILIYWKFIFNSLSTRRLKISVFLLFCSNFPGHFVRILGSCQFWFDPERLGIRSLWLVDSKFGSASVANERAFICPTPATLLNLIFTFYSFLLESTARTQTETTLWKTLFEKMETRTRNQARLRSHDENEMGKNFEIKCFFSNFAFLTIFGRHFSGC